MDTSLTRRSLIQGASAAGVMLLAGCGGGNSTKEKSVSRPSVIGITSDYPKESSSSSGNAEMFQNTGEEANTKEITIEGTIVTTGTCQVAIFEDFNYDKNSDTATITIGTEQDSSKYEDCDTGTQVEVKYRLRVEFDTIPGTLKIEHNGISTSVVGESSLETGSN